jgi:hypothetical protein
MMAFLVDAYREEEVPNAKGGTDTRTVLALDPRLAPVKVAVLPLSRNERLSPLAREVADDLRAQGWNVDFDDAGAIGRRYRRQDEIGTPFCVTVDFDSLDDRAVTVRDRDTMAQERIALDALVATSARACGAPEPRHPPIRAAPPRRPASRVRETPSTHRDTRCAPVFRCAARVSRPGARGERERTATVEAWHPAHPSPPSVSATSTRSTRSSPPIG